MESRRRDFVHLTAGLAMLCIGWTAFAWTDRSILITIDAAEQTYPWWLFGMRELQALRFPLWDPYIAGGVSAVGDAIRGFFYPPFLMFSLAGHYAMTTKAIYAFALLHFFIALSGAYVLGRSLRLLPPAALVVGIVYAFGGYLTRRSGGQLCIFNGDAWVPWSIAGVILAMKTRRHSWSVLAGACMGMSVLAGHFQPAIDGALIIAAVFVFLIFVDRDGETIPSRLRTAILVGTISLLTATAVSAVQLAACAEYLPLAFRWLGAIDPETGLTYGLASSRTPWEVIAANPSLPVTGLLGVPLKISTLAFQDASLYIGSTALLLVMIGFGCCERRTRLFWSGLIAFSIILATGASTPILKLVVSVVPLMDKVREPVRHLLLAHTAAAVCAGYGIAAVQTRDRRVPAVAAIFIASFVAIVALAIRFNVPKPDPRALAFGATMTAAALAIVLMSRRNEQASRLAIASLAVICFAELWYGWIWFMPTRSRFDGKFNRAVEKHYATPLARHVSDFLRDHPGTYRVDISNAAGGENIINFGSLIPDNYADIAHFLGTAGYGATKPAPFVTLGSRLGTHPPGTGARLLAVRYFMTSIRQNELVEVADWGKLRVYEDPHPVPWVRFVEHVEFSPSDEDTLERIQTLGARADTVIVHARQRLAVERLLGVRSHVDGAPSAEVTQYLPRTVTIGAQTDRPRMLATADPYFPGWRASIDSQSAPVVRINYAFRGVVVPAGKHTVVFRYEPWRIYRGMAISIAAMVMTAFVGFRHFRRRADATLNASPP